ncbi:MAG: WecB/TagA/CpsF family glycosyltransferase [Chloroflexota bacterium]|nr:MAG: acetylglucosaminyldiphospho-UDP acetyl-beta-D-mannosaminyltransferase [Chloroflexota bacterium]
MPRRVDILGVPVDVVTEPDALSFVRERIRTHTPSRVVTVNVEYVMHAYKDSAFAHVLQTADMATPDSAGILWAMRRQGEDVSQRVGGSDLIWSLSEQASREGHRVFLLGAAEGVAQCAASRLQTRNPNLTVAGTWAGSPGPSERAFIVDLIRRSQTDLLFVAFGSPRQDLWIAENLLHTGACVAIGVGGSFDYVAGTARRAPAWMRDRGMEWLWRLYRQPWRWRRMMAIPRFVWRVTFGGHASSRLNKEDM